MMKIVLRIFPLIALFLIVNKGFSQSKVGDESYKYMHMLSADEMYQKINYNFQETEAPVGPVRAIAEWETMSAVLVRYPFGIPIDFIKTLSLKDTVITLLYGEMEENYVRSQYQSAGVDMSRVKFFYANSDSYWTRDYGPWFIINGEKKVSVLNFNYNRPRENDNKVPQYIDDFLGMPYYAMNVVHTGGNFMTDGYGSSASTTIVYTESDDLGISNAQVDSKMLNYMGIDNHIVVNDPNNTYIDHIDCWGKFLDVDKILIRRVPTNHPQYSQVENMATYWANKTSKWGNKYQVYRVDSPNDEPYTNSLILNKRVFVPITGSNSDNLALAVYRNAMPGYEVIGVLNNTSSPWESTDALHCRTHEIADKNMINLIHYPLLGKQTDAQEYTINANIEALSGAGLNADSIILHYCYSNNQWQTATMVNIEGNTYSSTIINPVEGTSVSYYISAKDNIGKSITHPYVGVFDPHTFVTGYTSNAIENITLSCDTINFTVENHNPVTFYLCNRGSNATTISTSNFDELVHCHATPQNSEFTVEAGDSVSFEISPVIGYSKDLRGVYSEIIKFTTPYRNYSIVINSDNALSEEELLVSHRSIKFDIDTTIIFYVKNKGFLNSEIESITSTDNAIEVELMSNNSFPYSMPSGDSICMAISPIIPTYKTTYIADTIVVTTAQKVITLMVKTTDLFINPPEVVVLSQGEVVFNRGDEYPVVVDISNGGMKPAKFLSSNIDNLNYFVVDVVDNKQFPITLNAGEILQLSIRPRLNSDRMQSATINSETLKLTSEKKIYNIKLKADASFLTSIGNNEVDNIKCYPNPFTNYVEIDVNGIDGAVADVYCSSGLLVAQLKSAKGIIRWNAEHAPKGLYIIKIRTSRNAKTFKVVKE